MRIFPLIVVMVLSTSLMIPGIAFAHYPHIEDECSTTEELGSREECLIEQRESGKDVKFLDIYFSKDVLVGGNSADPNEIPNKIEVEPGDGTAILAAVMANSGPFELTGLRGWLSLPVGFNAAGRAAGEPAFDTYDLGIQPGATFVFEFPVQVTENTRVGMYNATLHVEFFEARNIGMNWRDFKVEFLLPGKSVLDAVAVSSLLQPSTKNTALIEIINDGSASASGVIVSLNPTEAAATIETETQAERLNQIINLGKKVFNIGEIKPHSKTVIDPILYVNPALEDTRQNLQFSITYFDAYGERRSATTVINFLVAGSTTESIDFQVTTDKPIIQTITEIPFTVKLENIGKETAQSVEVTVNTPLTATVALNQEVPEASRSPISIIGGDGYTRANEIAPGESFDVLVTLFASEEAVNTAFQLPVTISYLDSEGGLKRIQRQISVYVQGTISLRIYDVGMTYIGNEPNLSGFLLNEGTNMALFTTVELVSGDNKIKQSGNPQYLGDLTANSPLPFNIPVKFEGNSEDSYPVKIKITYKDDLRKPYEEVIDSKVLYTPPVIESKDQRLPSISSTLGVMAGLGAAGVAGYYLVSKKRHKRGSSAKEGQSTINSADADNDDDIDFLSDSKQ
ncbi:MAG: COG1361 S-layer family protein [Nitrososphaerales archaeon]